MNLKSEGSKTFPPEIRFLKPWREYQTRVLSELETHLNDHCLHIIAAPGSGKTVLGLEVMRRLDQPCLILAPTLAIRDQWIDRFLNLFCQDAEKYDWISKDMRNPKRITVGTYQRLHSLCNGHDVSNHEEHEEELIEDDYRPPVSERKLKMFWEKFIKALNAVGVKTIIIDEAHHLRNDWWRSLLTLKQALPQQTIVALTATPPFDVSYHEWARYKRLCGPVDTEISIPELVRAGNLCYHQDYIYLSSPVKSELDTIAKYRRDIVRYTDLLTTHKQFIQIIESHPVFRKSDEYVEKILDDPAFFSSMLVFLYQVGSRSSMSLVKMITGSRDLKIPPISLEWMEILLTGCFFTHEKDWIYTGQLWQELKQDLKRLGAIEGKKVHLRQSNHITRMLMNSLSKLSSIYRIVELESDALKDELRMVILTDYICREDLPRDEEDIQPINRMGVVPIFETLRRAKPYGIKLGVLTGSLVVIPAAAKDMFFDVCRHFQMDLQKFSTEALNYDPEYHLVQMKGDESSLNIKIMTEVFRRGGITVMVGTKSLLGEGWDAPCINTLIMASFVGSFVLSNQMRGRAIRALEGRSDKTSNIWHLVCVEEGEWAQNIEWETLARRFKAFVGVDYNRTLITNGLERLGLERLPSNPKEIKEYNQDICKRAVDRSQMQSRWLEALKKDNLEHLLVEKVKTPPSQLPRKMVITNTILALFLEGIYFGGFVMAQLLHRFGPTEEGVNFDRVWQFFSFAFIMGIIFALPKCIRSIILFIKHMPVTSSIKHIGQVLLMSLIRFGYIKTPSSKLKLTSDIDEKGYVRCSLLGATTYEQSLFLDALQEILEPLENPRYFLMSKTKLLWISRKDIYAVPALIAKKKEYAEIYRKLWEKQIGPAALVYARELEGRRKLLHARSDSLFTALQPRCERIKEWQ